MLRDELYEQGLDVRREMFGSGGAEQQTENTRAINDKMQEIVTRWCFGDIWSRPELDRRTRSIITVAMLVALGREWELNIHMRGALANGVTEEELREISLHAILYCGIPSANEGLRTLDAVLAAERADSPLLQPATNE
ncbi:MAG TPA: carboxymuconolactone decarboxylase family protein [Ilumatobacter sp.]|nr:carboxymuconolactone decarboxylase family protein [Ilumatobacter sp.]